MDNAVLTVIIPVYNVEKYLRQCVDSVLTQSLGDLLKIILVNDGSSDQSGIICDEYARINKRIKVIHKINGGLSSARNAGLDLLDTKYVTFLDSDDYLCDNNSYEKCINYLMNYNVDLILYYYNIFYDGETITDTSIRDMSVQLYSHVELLDMLFDKINAMYPYMAWNKIYKSELFHHIRFEANVTSEDVIIMPLIFSQCQNALGIKLPVVNYRIRNDSILHSVNSRFIADRVLSDARLCDFAFSTNNIKYIEIAVDHFQNRIFSFYYEVWRISKDDKNKRRESLNRIYCYYKKLFPEILKRKRSFRKRIMFILFRVHPILFYVANKMCREFTL